ncbi:MAG TPA: hypothetical protein VN231_05755 [Allosphingosinicella sp.]|nr:hypothetical protein [Allosphingosinicella sp.]
MKPVRAFLVLMLALVGACSMRSAINSLTSPEDRAFAQEMVSRLRSGDEAWLEQRFRPDLWVESGKQLGGVPALYPGVPGTTEIVGFNVSTNMANGRTERNKEFTLVTHGGGRWTVTTFRTFSTGGPDQVVQWSVVPSDTPPAELTMIESWDAAVPWVWGGLLITLLAVGGLVFWLVRRSRRRRDALAGQGRGTP